MQKLIDGLEAAARANKTLAKHSAAAVKAWALRASADAVVKATTASAEAAMSEGCL